MEVVYFFCGITSIRVPLFNYDERLFRLLKSRGGTWDRMEQAFFFGQNIKGEQFCRNFPGFPCVWVEENPEAAAQLQVFGFLGRPWGITATFNAEQTVKNTVTPASPLVLPDKFPEHWQLKLETELRSRKYSPRTRSSYVYYNRLLCSTLQKFPEEVQPEDIKRFLAVVEKDKNYSASSMNLAISAIKFFYRSIVKKEIVDEKSRPSRDKQLPMVLDKTEISSILSLEKNIKHRLLLMLVYSSGLRVSEVVALKREHIDISRKVIHIRLGKGRKDRYTILSDKASRSIAEYCSFCNIQTWLFPGQPATRHLSIRSAQHIFDNAVRSAGVFKKVSIHSLRHTFATHLLESGTDIRYIQALLGHSSLRTTERYTHIARRSILSIKSPLDTMH